MSIMKYECRRGLPRIEPIEVEKETPTFVWVKPWAFRGLRTGNARQTAKRGSYENYFDTWAEAHAFLMQDAEEQLSAARRDLQRAQALHGNIKGMKARDGDGSPASKVTRPDEQDDPGSSIGLGAEGEQ